MSGVFSDIGVLLFPGPLSGSAREYTYVHTPIIFLSLYIEREIHLSMGIYIYVCIIYIENADRW